MGNDVQRIETLSDFIDIEVDLFILTLFSSTWKVIQLQHLHHDKCSLKQIRRA